MRSTRSTATAVALLLAARLHGATVAPGHCAGSDRQRQFLRHHRRQYHDTYGLFGAVGGNLSGDTISGTYSYDTSVLVLFGAVHLRRLSRHRRPDTHRHDRRQHGGHRRGHQHRDHGHAGRKRHRGDPGQLRPGAADRFTCSPRAPGPGVTIDAPFTLDPTYFGQTIYVSADGSHYDVLDFAGTSAPATPARSRFAGIALRRPRRYRLGTPPPLDRDCAAMLTPDGGPRYAVRRAASTIPVRAGAVVTVAPGGVAAIWPGARRNRHAGSSIAAVARI